MYESIIMRHIQHVQETSPVEETLSLFPVHRSVSVGLKFFICLSAGIHLLLSLSGLHVRTSQLLLWGQSRLTVCFSWIRKKSSAPADRARPRPASFSVARRWKSSGIGRPAWLLPPFISICDPRSYSVVSLFSCSATNSFLIAAITTPKHVRFSSRPVVH